MQTLYGEGLIKDYMKREEYQVLVKDAESEARTKLAELVQSFNLPTTGPEIHLLHGDEQKVLAPKVTAAAVNGEFRIRGERTHRGGIHVREPASTHSIP